MRYPAGVLETIGLTYQNENAVERSHTINDPPEIDADRSHRIDDPPEVEAECLLGAARDFLPRRSHGLVEAPHSVLHTKGRLLQFSGRGVELSNHAQGRKIYRWNDGTTN